MLETKEDSSLKNTSMFWISDLMLLWSSHLHTMNDNIILCWLRMMWDMPCWTKSDHTLPMRMTHMQWHISWSIIYYLSVCNNNISPALNHTSSAGDDAMPPTAGAQELQAKAAAGAPQQPQEPRKPSSRQNAWQWRGAEPFNEMSPPFPTIQKKLAKKGWKLQPKGWNEHSRKNDRPIVPQSRALLPGIFLKSKVERWPGDVKQEATKIQKNKKCPKG